MERESSGQKVKVESDLYRDKWTFVMVSRENRCKADHKKRKASDSVIIVLIVVISALGLFCLDTSTRLTIAAAAETV